MVAPVERTVRANGLSFPTLQWGPSHGRAILLLHGFPQEARSWDQIARGLASAGYRVIAFDQRGYSEGTRPQNPHQYSFQLFVADALANADALDVERFDVAGMGMGAAQGWILAARHPQRVCSLVALRFPHPAAFANGIRTDPAQAESWAHLQRDLGGHNLDQRAAAMLTDDAAGLRAFLARSGLPQPWLDSYVTRLQRAHALAGAMAWEHAVSLDEFAVVPKVGVPTYYFWSQGPALTAATAQSTSRYVDGVFHLEELEDAGNFMIETSSDRILSRMLRFYQETGGPSQS